MHDLDSSEDVAVAATIPDAQTPKLVRQCLLAVAVFALLGLIFSGVSTADFISHLDRQVHSIHCSFIPGASKLIGESGCRTVMMSPYSSIFRTQMWGGLPISLLSFAVFAFLTARALGFATRKQVTRTETSFLVAGTLLPVLMSGIYGVISAVEIGTVCKLCVGIYVSSAGMFASAVTAHIKTEARPKIYSESGVFAKWFFQGCAYVAGMVLLYVFLAPVSDKVTEGCGRLVKTKARPGILIPFLGSNQGQPSIAVLDPLCPACRAFDERLKKSGLDAKLNIKMLLFPLDSKCNWMLKEALHPGACAVSEAIICDQANAAEIVNWAFENQEDLLALAKRSEKKLRKRIKKRFPNTKKCLGSARVRNKLNRSLRWAVANALPVLTPQLFIGDRRVCDEDTDLGLEYTITQMLRGGSAK